MKTRFFSATLTGAFFALFACGYDPDATTTLYTPDYTIYKEKVHQFVNQRCGTLDCHGQVGRPFRNYGSRGLRLYDEEAKLTPGGDATDEAEYRASYESIIGLEPEATRRVVACEQEVSTLLLFRKAAGRAPGDPRPGGEGERHKGGSVAATGTPGYACMLAWLTMGCRESGFGAQAEADCRAARALP